MSFISGDAIKDEMRSSPQASVLVSAALDAAQHDLDSTSADTPPPLTPLTPLTPSTPIDCERVPTPQPFQTTMTSSSKNSSTTHASTQLEHT